WVFDDVDGCRKVDRELVHGVEGNHTVYTRFTRGIGARNLDVTVVTREVGQRFTLLLVDHGDSRPVTTELVPRVDDQLDVGRFRAQVADHPADLHAHLIVLHPWHRPVGLG